MPQPRFATHPSKYQANKILAEFQRFAHVECRIRSNEANKKCIASMFVGRVRQCFSAVSDGLTCLAGERPVVDDEQARVAETLKKLHRGDMDIVAYEDEHKFDGDGDEPA
ncbi:hypothetical protein ACS8R2_02025 [Bifidobacterium longum]|uniref:hypothetical protein n=1 Tax=Bifidobacterium longum TaxID=216816 RepID=UPI0015FE02AA|nr:hypothetical protein [Bifidobacterium longum]